jgi:hypothetical protein
MRIASVGESSRLTSLRNVSGETSTAASGSRPFDGSLTRTGSPSRISMSHVRSPIA